MSHRTVLGVRVSMPYVATVEKSRRFFLGRWRWESQRLGRAVSHEVSASIYFEPRDLWVGLYWEHDEFERWCFYLCLLPCLPLRVKFRRSWGGRFG
jgi:hypothetical protein